MRVAGLEHLRAHRAAHLSAKHLCTYVLLGNHSALSYEARG
jgi:hypothetical protein